MLALFTTGCRSGDVSACTDREVRACSRTDERDAVELAFLGRGYDRCEAAVEDNSCGIDAEALRRCVDALPTPLCVGAPYHGVAPEVLFETTPCLDELNTFLACENDDDDSSYRNRRRSSRDWDDDD